MDGLTGFPDAIQRVYPQAKIQLIIVQMLRNSLKYVAEKHMKEVAYDLKGIYQSLRIDEGARALDPLLKDTTLRSVECGIGFTSSPFLIIQMRLERSSTRPRPLNRSTPSSEGR